MIKYYIQLALRNFKRNGLTFLGGILTLFLGALCISLLASYIHNELSMNNFHKREKDIYMLMIQASAESEKEVIDAKLFFDWDFTQYPEIDNLATLNKYSQNEISVVYEDNFYYPEVAISDSNFFKIFDFKILEGNKESLLTEPNTAIITKQFAKKIFGNENAIGKSIKVSARKDKLYTITGVMNQPGPASSMQFDFIISDYKNFFSRSGANFILVNSNFNVDDFNEKIQNIGHKHPQFKKSIGSTMAFKDTYFQSKSFRVKGILSKSGDQKSIKILFTIIGIIFLITLLNFSNLQIININNSLRTIGINKITGARKKDILLQKCIEFALIVLFSSILISIGYFLLLPTFNSLTGTPLAPPISYIFVLNLIIVTVTVLVAMIFPINAISRIPLIQSIKELNTSKARITGRKVITTTQFALTFILLISVFVITRQLNMMLNKDLGFKTENTIKTVLFRDKLYRGEDWKNKHQEMRNNFQAMMHDLESQSSIKSLCQGVSPIDPFDMPWKVNDGQSDYTTQNAMSVTPNFCKHFGLELVEGRFFDASIDEQRKNKIVINEAAKKYWHIDDISQSQLNNKYWGGDKRGFEILGVVKDFNSEHLSVTPQPMVMLYFEDRDANFFIQFEKESTQAGIAKVEEIFQKYNPGEIFTYSFLDDEIAQLYVKEKRLGNIYMIFTIIALLVSAIGLFTVALYDCKKRTKEIGVRKVNGATNFEVVNLVNYNLIKWVGLAFIIACPIGWYMMYKWLEGFAYKTALSWWIFALAGLLALGVALLAVSWQSWNAARRNPVEALRYE